MLHRDDRIKWVHSDKQSSAKRVVSIMKENGGKSLESYRYVKAVEVLDRFP